MLLCDMNKQFAEHFRALCEKHRVATYEHPDCRPYAYPTLRKIHIHPVTCEKSYATALHELGHCVLRHAPEQPRAWKELLAWKWARANAVVWTPGMSEFEALCLGTWEIFPSDNVVDVIQCAHQVSP